MQDSSLSLFTWPSNHSGGAGLIPTNQPLHPSCATDHNKKHDKKTFFLKVRARTLCQHFYIHIYLFIFAKSDTSSTSADIRYHSHQKVSTEKNPWLLNMKKHSVSFRFTTSISTIHFYLCLSLKKLKRAIACDWELSSYLTHHTIQIISQFWEKVTIAKNKVAILWGKVRLFSRNSDFFWI